MLSYIRSRRILLFSCLFHVILYSHVELVRVYKPLYRFIGSSFRKRVRRIILIMDLFDFNDFFALIELAEEYYIDY
jgi:hypothetical protein